MDYHGGWAENPVPEELGQYIVASLRQGMSDTEFAMALGIPLAKAAATGDVDKFRQLEDAGAFCRPNFRARGWSGRTLIGCATIGGNTDIVRSVLEKGAPPNSRGVVRFWGAEQISVPFGKTRETPLHVAVTSVPVCEPLVTLLLEFGADPNAMDSATQTPLHLACINSDVGVIRHLLSHGADERKLTRNGKTPMDLVKTNRKEIESMMARERAWRNRGWMVVCRARAMKSAQQAGGGEGTLESLEASTPKRTKPGAGEEEDGRTPVGDDGAGGDGPQVDDLAWLAGKLIRLECQGIFRRVVTFL